MRPFYLRIARTVRYARRMNGYTAYFLTPDTTQALLKALPPAFATIKADHVTHRYGVTDFGDIAPSADIHITHYIRDPQGLDVLKVTVNGQETKPDGQPYHITWSINETVPMSDALCAHIGLPTPRPYQAKDSNDLVTLALSGKAPEQFIIKALDIRLPRGAVTARFIAPDKTKHAHKAPRP